MTTTETEMDESRKAPTTNGTIAVRNRWTANTFDVDHVQFSKKMQNPNIPGRYQVYINHAMVSRGKWYMQTPMMRAPFGISRDTMTANAPGDVIDDNKTSDTKLTLTLSFGSRHPDVETLRTKLIALEDKLLDHAVENSKEWFGKSCTREVVESMFNPLVRKHPTGQWPDNINIKIYTRRDDPSTYVLEGGLYAYDPEVPSEEPVNVQDICESITRNTDVQVMFSFAQVYFTGKRGFGISVKAHMIRFLPNEIHAPLSFVEDDLVVQEPLSVQEETVQAGDETVVQDDEYPETQANE